MNAEIYTMGTRGLFLALSWMLQCRPQDDRSSAKRPKSRAATFQFLEGHYKDLTATGNRALKVSGTLSMKFIEMYGTAVQ